MWIDGVSAGVQINPHREVGNVGPRSLAVDSVVCGSIGGRILLEIAIVCSNAVVVEAKFKVFEIFTHIALMLTWSFGFRHCGIPLLTQSPGTGRLDNSARRSIHAFMMAAPKPCALGSR